MCAKTIAYRIGVQTNMHHSHRVGLYSCRGELLRILYVCLTGRRNFQHIFQWKFEHLFFGLDWQHTDEHCMQRRIIDCWAMCPGEANWHWYTAHTPLIHLYIIAYLYSYSGSWRAWFLASNECVIFASRFQIFISVLRWRLALLESIEWFVRSAMACPCTRNWHCYFRSHYSKWIWAYYLYIIYILRVLHVVVVVVPKWIECAAVKWTDAEPHNYRLRKIEPNCWRGIRPATMCCASVCRYLCIESI